MRFVEFFRLDDEHPFTGRHMIAVVLLFFGTIIAVNIAMVVAATGTFPGLVVANSYVASQRFNERLADARAQEDAGWQSELKATDGVLTFKLLNRGGFAEHRLAVTVLAGRPSTTQEDRLIELLDTPDGYRAVETLPSGMWEVDIEARRNGSVVFADRRRIRVSSEGEG